MTEIIIQPAFQPEIEISAPLPPAEEAIEIVEEQVDARVAFAEHAQYVRENGDALELSKPWVKPSVGMYCGAVVHSAIATEIFTFAATSNSAIPAVAGGAYVGAVGVKHKRKVKRLYDESLKRMADPAQIALGESYELFRVNNKATRKPELVLHWDGTIGIAADGQSAPQNPDKNTAKTASESEKDTIETRLRPAAESMRLLANLAETNDISLVIFEPEILTKIPDGIERFATAKVPVMEWLRDTRKVYAKLKRKRERFEQVELAFTPGQLKALANEMDKKPYDIEELEGVIEVLRMHAPEHPLIATFDTYKQLPDTAAQKVGTIARRSLERQLGDVTATRLTKHDAISLADSNNLPLRQKIYIESHIKDTVSKWQGTGKRFGELFGQADLAMALNTTEADIQTVLAHPDRYSKKDIMLAAEYAAYAVTCQPPRPKPDEDQEVITAPVREYNLQHAINRSLISWDGEYVEQEASRDPEKPNLMLTTALNHAVPRAMTKVLLGTVTVFCVLQGESTAEKMQTDLKTASEQAYARQLGIGQYDLTDAEKKLADKVALDGHPLLQGYEDGRHIVSSGITDLSKQLARLIHHGSHGGSGGSDGSGEGDAAGGTSGIDTGSTSIGNVKQSPGDAQAEWTITSHGGMASEGYWATNTMTSLDGNNWEDLWKKDVQSTVLPLAWQHPDQPSLTVTRFIHQQDYDNVDSEPSGKNLRRFYIHIPVKDGTEPVALSFKGQREPLKLRNDGTYEMELEQPHDHDKPSTGNLTYTLAPLGNTVLPVRAALYNSIQGDDHNHQRQESQAVWDTSGALDGQPQPGLTPLGIVQHEADYIRKGFSYSYAPLDEDTRNALSDKPPQYASYVDGVLNTKKANCNVAASTIAIANPSVDPAVGYHNDGDDKLAAGEAHMWLVDGAGHRVDATPYLQEQQSAAPQPNDDNLEREIIELGGLGLLMGAGYLAMSGSAGWRARRSLDRMSADSLRQAKDSADMALFGPVFDSVRLSGVSDALTHQTALQGLSNAHLHTKQVQRALRKKRRTAKTEQDRIALRRAARTLRLVRRAGLANQLLDPDDVTGVLS